MAEFFYLTGSCNQYHWTPTSCKISKSVHLSPGVTSIVSPSFEQGALPQHCLGALPPVSWPRPISPARASFPRTTAHQRHGMLVPWVPPPGLQIFTSPRPALAPFLTHSRKRKDTCGVALACLTLRARVRHMANGQPFLRKSVQAWPCPPPSTEELPLPEAG